MEKNTLLKDSDWSSIKGEPCRVIDFIPWGKVGEDGEVVAMNLTTPYASVKFECKKIEGVATGFITHKADFANLWSAFRERGVGQDEEVIIIYDKGRLGLKGFAKMFLSTMFPGLRIWICPKGTFESVNPDAEQELSKVSVKEWGAPEVNE